MKTLIFNGSPRKNGDTVFLINKLKESLNGEIKVIDTYLSPIKPSVQIADIAGR
jgi:multimeric flavodoxin WrbA